VAISSAATCKLVGVTSQGCTPIGETWTLTKVEQNIIHQIGNRPAYEVLAETFNQLTPEQQKQARGNLFIGLVVNEYLEDFHRGDFLIRNLLGADPRSGSIAVGALPRLGQTVQFQRRSERGGHRGHGGAAHARPERTGRHYRSTAAACAVATGGARTSSAARITTPRWSSSGWGRWVWPASSAMARSGRWARKASCTATRRRSRCS
jgi:hypothetical protein